MTSQHEHGVRIEEGRITLEGILGLQPGPRGLVIFAHGSGSKRISLSNNFSASTGASVAL